MEQRDLYQKSNSRIYNFYIQKNNIEDEKDNKNILVFHYLKYIMTGIEYRIYDPKEDFIFKMLFGTEENKSILISLLNAILKGRPNIKDLTLENNEISKIFKDSKSSRLDILAVDDNGIKYDIEMQCQKTKDIPNRAAYYASKLFTKDLKENDDYNKSRVISIWIFAENVTERHEPLSEAFMTFQPNKSDNYEIMTDNIKIIYLELKKYLINSHNYNDKLTKWVDFLTNPINLDRKTIEDKDIEKAKKTLEYISTNDEERLIIDKIVEGRNDFYSAKNIAKEEGIEEGVKIGLKEGLKKGINKGLKEGKIEIAKNMLKKQLDIKLISELSGLTIDEINELK